MTGLAIDLNDAQIAVADGNGLLHSEPGYIVVDGGATRFGADASSTVRCNPQSSSITHWRDFGSETGSRARDLASRRLSGHTSSTELAAAQLAHLWSRYGTKHQGVYFAVPTRWTGTRVEALRTLAARLSIPVTGIAVAAVAACRHPQPSRELLCLEAGLHSLTMSHIRQAGQAGLGAHEEYPALGMEPLMRLATELLARRFVASSRFDPLHNPDAEQALYDQLPDWFSRLARGGDLTLALETPGGTFDATLSAPEFRTQMALACEPLLQRLRVRIAERGPHQLQVHARLAEVPGIIEGLRRLPDTVVHVLPPGAAAQGLIGSRVTPGMGNLVVELPWADGPADFSTPASEPSAPSASVPTHVLMGHQLYRLGPQPFRIGSALEPGESGLALDPALRGLSRQHCTLRVEHGALFVFDHSRFGTRLNGHRIDGTAMLQPGDRLSLGSPPVELRLLIEGDVNGP